MSKPKIIPNWKYQKPTQGGYRGLKKLLKYVSYRESPDHRPLDAEIRWTDCGLGDSWKSVYEHASRFVGPYVLAHHMVISPAPDLMQLIPENSRPEIVKEVTEQTIETWHIERGLEIPHVARQRRKLTKAIVKEAVELYLEAMADEIASGEWVDVKDIGKIQVMQEEANGVLTSFGKNGIRVKRLVTHRLRTKVRLYQQFKKRYKDESI